MRKNRKKVLIIGVVFAAALAGGLFLVLQSRTNFKIDASATKDVKAPVVDQAMQNYAKSPISGLACSNAKRRPLAVMLGGDVEVRPLSGIGQADIVFEMQVVQGSITRYMAVFVCASPSQIGSVRSARQDFIPLADGLNAIYGHWGGSHFALDILNNHVMDNLDALPNPFDSFYRISGVDAPFNGFTSTNRLINAAQKLGYSLDDKFAGYPHLSDLEMQNHGQESKALTIGYPSPFDVKFQYDPSTNSYLRFRGGTKEIDKNTNQQVAVKNVVIMRSQTAELEGQYNTVQVTGTGKAAFYLNGQEIIGTWKKDKSDNSRKLFFYDSKGAEIKFVPGSIWVALVDPSIAVSYK